LIGKEGYQKLNALFPGLTIALGGNWCTLELYWDLIFFPQLQSGRMKALASTLQNN
jgi:hypothetical protein